MTKKQMLTEFYEIILENDEWRICSSAFVDYWIHHLTKETCKTLYDLANDGIYNFRIYDNLIYWLDPDYNRHIVWSKL